MFSAGKIEILHNCDDLKVGRFTKYSVTNFN